MKAIRIHRKVTKKLEDLEFSMKQKLAELLALLAEGEGLGMPVSRPMPVIEHGVHELRIKDHTGQFRVFYERYECDFSFPSFQKEDAGNASAGN